MYSGSCWAVDWGPAFLWELPTRHIYGPLQYLPCNCYPRDWKFASLVLLSPLNLFHIYWYLFLFSDAGSLRCCQLPYGSPSLWSLSLQSVFHCVCWLDLTCKSDCATLHLKCICGSQRKVKQIFKVHRHFHDVILFIAPALSLCLCPLSFILQHY